MKLMEGISMPHVVKWSKFKIELDTVTEEGRIILYEKWINAETKEEEWKICKEKIGGIDFTIHRKGQRKIEITGLEIDKDHRKKGLGRLIMRMIIALGEYFNLPIELDSLEDAKEFYKKLGMTNPKDTIMVWKPKKRNHK